jgi:nucleotide-binding universal stress UspA family protein
VKETFRTDWCAPLPEANVRYREAFGNGRAGPVLVEAANRDDVNLIVTGRRGPTALVEHFAGSVGQYLVHRSGRPVVVIPHLPA